MSFRQGIGVVIEEGCSVGEDSYIGNYSILKSGTVIGKNTTVGHLTVFEESCIVGDDCLIHSQCHITTGTIIENKVFIAPGYIGANDSRMVYLRREKVPFVCNAPVIRFGSRLAIGVRVLPGIIIAKQSMIGVGAVVTRDTKPFGVYTGIPAKFRGLIPEEERL